MEPFGKFFKKFRLKHFLTQEQVSRRGGFNVSTIFYLENETKRTLRIKTLIKIAKAFNLKGWQLLRKYEEDR